MAETSAGNLKIGIKMDFSGLRTQMKRVEAVIKKSVERIKKAFSTMAQHAKKAILGIGVAVAAFTFLTIRAAMKQEDALFGLQAALSNTGDATRSAMKDFKEFAAGIQKVTVFGDEEVLALIALQKNLGVATKDLKKATKMTIGLAAATGRSADTMAMYVAMALQGETTMLRRFIPALRTTTSKTQELALITAFAANGFKVAEARALTTSGGLKQLWGVLGDLAEAFGEPLLRPIRTATKWIKDFVEKSTKRLQRFTKEFSIAFKFNVEDIGFPKTIKKILSAFWKVMKINTIAWAKGLFTLLSPIFRKLGQELGTIIAGAIPERIVGVKIRPSTIPEMEAKLQDKLNFMEQLKVSPLPKGMSQKTRHEAMEALVQDYVNLNDELIRVKRNVVTMGDLKEGVKGFNEEIKKGTELTKKFLKEQLKVPEAVRKAAERAAAADARKTDKEQARIKAEIKKNIITAAFTSSAKAELSKIFRGVTSAGAAVALTGQEVFKSRAPRISPDAIYIGGKVIDLKEVLEKQTKERIRLENIDTGEGQLVSPQKAF